MIPRENRFRGYGSLKYVYRVGKTARGPLLAVKATSNSRRRQYRAAVVVSRKVNKSAVVRNRIRRRLYEIIRQLSPEITQPYDIVVTVFHDSVKDEPQPALQRQLRKQLREAGVLK